MTTPFVSFICPTFNRAPLELSLLGEKVYWFTRQEYPLALRELLILNDCNDQTLTCKVPGVRVVNYPHKFKTLGDKMNALQVLAKGDVIIPDEDDDISLPNRAWQAMQRLSGGLHYWNPHARWYQDGPFKNLVPDGKNCTHHATCYRRGSVVYPSLTGNQDQVVEQWIRNQRYVTDTQFTKTEDLSYVYRFGVSRLHLSAQGDMQRAWDNQAVIPGLYEITPVMVRDYAREAEELKGLEIIRG